MIEEAHLSVHSKAIQVVMGRNCLAQFQEATSNPNLDFSTSL